MTGVEQPLSGTEYVLLAEVPKGGDRWQQVGLNRRVINEFFRITSTDKEVFLQAVSIDGRIRAESRRPFVRSRINLNPRLEFDFGGRREYPKDGPPLLVVLELGTRRFRYVVLFAGDDGYEALVKLNESLPRYGQGAKRSRTNLDAVELEWPACPLRYAVA